jgi:uncharacterized membrane protein
VSAAPTTARPRIPSVDILRGAIMIIMALDHVRDFFSSATFQPTDLTRTTAAYFFTRWITHFCAPGFMLTAGLGAFFLSRKKSKRELSRFLWTRGLWLVILDETLMHFALSFHLNYDLVILNVLWALGWSMIALAALVWLPTGALTVLSVAIIALHNLADGIQARQFGAMAPLWLLLHQQGIFHLGSHQILVAYPLIPWIAVMAAGFCCGRIYTLAPERRRKILLQLGIVLTATFILLRAINIYGDPFHWSPPSVLSFLNTTKYPPSLDFLLMTLGPALIVLGLIDRATLSPWNPLVVFGRTPFLYFVGHFFLAHLLASIYRHTIPSAANGVGLPAVYFWWIVVVAAMYPPCRWFAQLKQHRTNWWLSYL